MCAVDRRRFLQHSLSVSALAVTGVSLSACGSDDGFDLEFLYGVASGDPLADRVILWTHTKIRDRSEPVEVDWEVSLDNTFGTTVSRGTALSSADTGFTVKVDATGLQPGTDYFFR
ncbi:MAG: PhoD-like phosphatase N-terminal domain-containing protein, partial [Betaproteobacteria bacterium]